MYLSNLEITGFKSFVRRIQFKFGSGITAIVGPNGCGKTNVVDAIRWTLGEQRSSILRSDIMEDVIFNGTKNRKPLSMAESSITIQNNKQILPTEYTEVTLTRRIYRDGESHYYLNGARCRLRDVQNLFMDTGIGADTYSVIELKMVEAILSGKAEERRSLIEEAAGVKKYKARKKEASRKLENVKGDLERAADIADEIKKQVNSLSRQASKTRRYNKLTEELKILESNLLFRNYGEYSTKLDALKKELEELNKNRDEKKSALKKAEEELDYLRTELSELDSKYQEAAENESELKSKQSEYTRDIAVAKEKINSLKSSVDRLNNEIERSNKTKEEIKNDLASRETDLNKTVEKKNEFEEEIKSIKENREKARSALEQAREETEKYGRESFNLQKEIEGLFSEIENWKNRKSSLENSLKASVKEIEAIKVKIMENEEKAKSLVEKKEELKKREEETDSLLRKANERKKELNELIDKIKEDISDKKNELSGKKTSLDFLEGLFDADESSKYLLKSKDWLADKEKILLAEALGVDDKYRIAVDAALGEFGRYFIVDSKDEAEQAIEKLKKSNKGKASFICKELSPKNVSPPPKINDQEGVHGWASELVRAADPLKNAIRAVLGKTLIVENTDAAWTSVKDGLCDCAVDLNGEIVKTNGLLRGGSKKKKESLAVGKKERIKKIKSQIKEIEKELSKLEGSLKAANKEKEAIDIEEINEKIKRINLEKSENENLSNEIKYKIESLKQNIKVHEDNNARFDKELNEIDKNIEESLEKIKSKQDALDEISEKKILSDKELKKLQGEFNVKDEEFRSFEKEGVKLQQGASSLEKEIENLKKRAAENESDVKSRGDELISAQKEIENLKRKNVELESALTETTEKTNEAQSKREYLSDKTAGFKEDIKIKSEEFENFRNEFDSLQEKIHVKEISASELSIKVGDMKAKARDDLDVDLENNELEIDETVPIDEQKEKVGAVKEKLAKIGAVNFMALEEYESQKERLQFYENQIKDLEESEKNLIETIDEINQTARQKFRETFDRVNKHFQGLFKNLFGMEGEADLHLSEGDPLESDVQITAKPPGKRPRSIEGLSSGEKALTAIAMLFAIYLVKPSPFCILDEVDAPLDDANIDRFLDLIRDFSEDTQFVIVTHNKKTMEYADVLYGITMEEEGVSKAVSVKLNKASEN